MQHTLNHPLGKLKVVAWQHSTPIPIERLHDPRSHYVEKYWLGLLGPSSTWLLRYFADELEASPNGFIMDPAMTAAKIGVSASGRHSAFQRALRRLIQFDFAKRQANVLAVRTTIPTLTLRNVSRLTPQLRAEHEHWYNVNIRKQPFVLQNK